MSFVNGLRALAIAAGVLGAVFGLSSVSRSQAVKGKKYALLVGVAAYNHSQLPDLKFTENDVEALAEVLRKPKGGFDSVRVLSTTRGKKNRADMPTKANI